MYKTATNCAREKNHLEFAELLANCPSQLIATLTAKNDQLSEENARLKQQIGANQLRISELEEESSAPDGQHGCKKLKTSDKSQSDREESLKKKVKKLKKKIKSLEKQKAPPSDPFQFLDSETIWKLRTIGKISTGSFGKVLEVAKEEHFALKVHHFGEYEKLASLDHPNIVHANGFFLSDASNPHSILLELCLKDLKSALERRSHTIFRIVV